MSFKLRELEQFVAVAEELHFGRAAERVGINEGPLSNAISRLEKRLGVHLFIRTPRSTRLTALGKTFLVDARRILADIEQAQNTLTTTVSGRRGRLRIGLSDGMAHPRIAKMMLEIQREEPLLELKTHHLRSEDQGRAFINDKLDLGFIMCASDVPKYCDSESIVVPLWSDPVVLVMTRDHPLAAQSVVQNLDGVAGPMIVVVEHYGFEPTALEELLPPPNSIANVRSVETVDHLLILAAIGYGIGVMSAAHAETLNRPDLAFRLRDFPVEAHPIS